MSKKIFAFIGIKGSGKDTAADFLQNIYEKNVHGSVRASFAFADILKEISHSALDITTNQSEYLKREHNLKIANGLSLREFYNRLGDSLKAQFGLRVFTDLTTSRVRDTIINLNPNLITVTDVRYPMEKAALQKLADDTGVELITIKMINTKLALPSSNNNDHESETQIDEIDATYTIEACNPIEIQIKIEEIYNEL